MIFCDAHFHLLPSLERISEIHLPGVNYAACTAAHSKDEFLLQEKFILEHRALFVEKGRVIIQSFALHPQMPLLENAPFLEGLLQERRIEAVGECGLDFWNEEFKANRENQVKAFEIQLELAARFNVPAVIHARKAMQEIFSYSDELKKVPSVIFHSFAGSPADARSLLKRGINAYFSFGKPLLNGAKKAIASVRTLPLERLLFETDAPYQTLKGELATSPAEIYEVYQAAFECRASVANFYRNNAMPFSEFLSQIYRNFQKAYMQEFANSDTF